MGNRLFIYGTLINPEVQKNVLGRVADGVPDALIGYKKSEIEVEGKEYPLIVPDEGEKVGGLVINVADRELEKIDEYETAVYKRKSVVLERGISAWVYVKG
ncbi:MAG: gamma-glutamylcyclotransferase family protein [Patescibacteria group bacterium]